MTNKKEYSCTFCQKEIDVRTFVDGHALKASKALKALKAYNNSTPTRYLAQDQRWQKTFIQVYLNTTDQFVFFKYRFKN